MQSLRFLRLFMSALTSCTLALILLLSAFAAPIAKASGPGLVINEVNWAGSAGNSHDEWIELYNNTDSSILLSSSNPYRLYRGTTLLAEITSGIIPARGFYLISALPIASSSLGIFANPDLVLPGLTLPNIDAHYILKDDLGVIIDAAGLEIGAPFAGSAGTTGEMIIASQARTFPIVDGTLASSWFTPTTNGMGFDAGLSQAGTPSSSLTLPMIGTSNLELAHPSNLLITPTAPTISTMPTVSGNLTAPANRAIIGVQKIGESTVQEQTVLPAPDNTFTATIFPNLVPGLYRVMVTAFDPSGNHTPAVEIPIPGSPQNVYVIQPTTTVVAPPILNAFLPILNTDTVTLSGSVASGTAVVIEINDTYVATENLASGQTTFSLPITLNKNVLNRIEVRARDAAGNTSAPAVAEITHDSIVPEFNVSLIRLMANPPGTSDGLLGLAGAAEAGALIEAYADQALSQKIASVLAAADGSFPLIDLGDNRYSRIYLTQKDLATNLSRALLVENPISFASQNLNITLSFSDVSQDKATIKWEGVAGAANYRLKYKIAGGTYSNPIDLCPGLASTCILERTVINLQPNTQYVLAIAAVDQFGNESNYTEQSFRTLTPVAVAPVTPVKTTPTKAVSRPVYNGVGGNPQVSTGRPTDTVVRSTPTPTAAPTATPVAPSSPTPSETGDVKSAQDTAANRNWTPWIILAVLIGLAVLATAGYFYWFGGEAGEAAMASAMAEKQRRDELNKIQDRDSDSNDEDDGPPGNNKTPESRSKDELPKNREKRW